MLLKLMDRTNNTIRSVMRACNEAAMNVNKKQNRPVRRSATDSQSFLLVAS